MGIGYIYVCLTVALTTIVVECYPDGVGVDSACSSMTPDHGVSPMNSTPPYYVYVNQNYYQPGESNTVTIGSFDTTFKGFMIQARRVNYWEDQTEILGDFTVVSDTRAACYGHALVHSNSNSKRNLTITWLPPSTYSGDIVFRVTFVQSQTVFWTNVTSETVYGGSWMETHTIKTSTIMPSTAMITTSGPSVIYKDYYCGSFWGCLTDCGIYGCGFTVSWYVSSSQVAYTLKSRYPAPGFYLAIGFSKDKEMGDDSVMGCVYQNGQVYKFTGENVDQKGPALFFDSDVQLLMGTYIDDILTCTLLRPIAGQGQRYDLNEDWTLFFAKGVANVVDGNIHLYYHENDVYISTQMVSAYSAVDLKPIEADPDDVNADSAESLMQTGSLKIIVMLSFAIYYLTKKCF